MKKTVVAVLSFCSMLTSSQSLKPLFDSSMKAYENKEYALFLTQTKTLDSLRPCHPKFTYNLASAYALNNQSDAAFEMLEKIVLMNNSINFESDADFKSIQNLPRYQTILKLKRRMNDSVVTSKKKLKLNEKDLHPEGLVFLNNQNIGLATGIRKRKIVAFDLQSGACSDWLNEKEMLAVFSMKTDSKNEFLWVATAAIPEMENYTKELEGKAEILKVNINTRQILKRFTTEGSPVFGDLVVTKDDVVYISDSNQPIIYKIENDKLSEWLNLKNEAFNLQGITINSLDDKLFIADYLKGILAVSTKDKTKHWLQFPKGTTQKGIDGLTFYNNTLIAIHNGVTPIRIVQYVLNDYQTQIESFKILDHNRSEFKEPVLGVMNRKSFYFFCNSPWNAYSKSFELDATRHTNPLLFELKF